MHLYGTCAGSRSRRLLQNCATRVLLKGVQGRRAGGTGSQPPRVNGWQRSSLHTASTLPCAQPCSARASAAYSEQLG